MTLPKKALSDDRLGSTLTTNIFIIKEEKAVSMVRRNRPAKATKRTDERDHKRSDELGYFSFWFAYKVYHSLPSITQRFMQATTARTRMRSNETYEEKPEPLMENNDVPVLPYRPPLSHS